MIQISKNSTDLPEIVYKTGAKKGINKIDEALALLIQFYDSNKAKIDLGKKKVPFKSSIYGHRLLKAKLVDLQHGKCAFCESKVKKIGYGDVEHFRPKAAYQRSTGDGLSYPGYYWLAYEWANLLFSCQLCNQAFKKNLFPLIDENTRSLDRNVGVDNELILLVHPVDDNPEEFIEFEFEVPIGIDDQDRGKGTIELLGLDRLELNEARKEVLDTFIGLLKIIEMYPDDPGMKEYHDRAKNYIRTKIYEKMSSSSEYSSMFKSFYKKHLEGKI